MEKINIRGRILNAEMPWQHVEDGQISFKNKVGNVPAEGKKCDKYGCFMVPLAPGDYEVTADAADMLPQTIELWRLKDPGNYDSDRWPTLGHYVNFALLPDDSGVVFAFVSGIVKKKSNGEAIAGATITWSTINSSTWTTSWFIPGHRGKYAKNLIAGTYTRTVEAPGCATDYATVSYVDGLNPFETVELDCP